MLRWVSARKLGVSVPRRAALGPAEHPAAELGLRRVLRDTRSLGDGVSALRHPLPTRLQYSWRGAEDGGPACRRRTRAAGCQLRTCRRRPASCVGWRSTTRSVAVPFDSWQRCQPSTWLGRSTGSEAATRRETRSSSLMTCGLRSSRRASVGSHSARSQAEPWVDPAPAYVDPPADPARVKRFLAAVRGESPETRAGIQALRDAGLLLNTKSESDQ